jgi:hypothetical protein
MLPLSFSECKHPFTLIYAGGGPARGCLSGRIHALSFSQFKHPFTLIYVGGGPIHALSFSVFKHPFTLMYVGGGAMRECLLLAGYESSCIVKCIFREGYARDNCLRHLNVRL